MSDDTAKPHLTIVRFNRDHDNPNGAPPGALRRTLNAKTSGFLRGTNIAVGDKVRVTSGEKVWTGTVTGSAADYWSRPPYSMGVAWLFDVETEAYVDDPIQEDKIRVTVTVTTQTLPVQTSDPFTPTPDPSTVP